MYSACFRPARGAHAGETAYHHVSLNGVSLIDMDLRYTSPSRSDIDVEKGVTYHSLADRAK